MNHKCSNKIDLSVVVPLLCKNGVHSNLISWIEDLINLNCRCIEVVIVLDFSNCSESASVECRELLTPSLGKLNNYKKVEGSFGSPGLSRNAALGLVKGKHIMFWDADDIPKVSMIYKLLPFGDDAIYIFGYQKVQVSGQTLSVTRYPASSIRFSQSPGIWRIAFTNNSVRQLKFSASRMGEDLVFIANVLLSGGFSKVMMRPEITYDYYVGVAGQLTSNSVAIMDQGESIREMISLISESDGARFKESMLVAMMTAWQVASLTKRNLPNGIVSGFHFVGALSKRLMWKFLHRFSSL